MIQGFKKTQEIALFNKISFRFIDLVLPLSVSYLTEVLQNT